MQESFLKFGTITRVVDVATTEDNHVTVRCSGSLNHFVAQGYSDNDLGVIVAIYFDGEKKHMIEVEELVEMNITKQCKKDLEKRGMNYMLKNVYFTKNVL